MNTKKEGDPNEFTTGDLSLSDCWKIVKVAFRNCLYCAMFFGFTFLTCIGYEEQLRCCRVKETDRATQ